MSVSDEEHRVDDAQMRPPAGAEEARAEEAEGEPMPSATEEPDAEADAPFWIDAAVAAPAAADDDAVDRLRRDVRASDATVPDGAEGVPPHSEPSSPPDVPTPAPDAAAAPSASPAPDPTAAAPSLPPPPPVPAQPLSPEPPPAPARTPAPAPAPAPERVVAPTPPVTRAPLPTSSAFTDDRMLRPQATAPTSGWRRLVHQASGGRITPPPSQAELARRELIARVTTPIKGARTIAVISRKGGVGKTTTTLMLGHTFATHRGDRVVALDGNPDAGSLGYRVRRETDATVTDLLDDAHRISRYADLRSYTTQTATRLEVVASDDDPHITQAIGRNEYRNAVEVLERHYNLIMLDTGTGILDSATQGILRCADQLVVVMAPSLDGARAAGLTLDWLDQHGFGSLASQAVAVLNANRQGGLVEVDKLEEHFTQRCRAAVRIPWDPHLDAGAETDIDALRPATRDAYLRLAATVADGFTHASARRADRI